MAKVTCRKCGKKVEKSSAYRVVVGKVNTYYCNQEEYESIQRDKKNKSIVYNIILEIFEYRTVNTALLKELSEIYEVYGVDSIKEYLEDQKEYLKSVIQSKDFYSEYAKIKYLSAIIKNSVVDFKKKNSKKEEKKMPVIEYDKEDIHMKFQRKKKRRSLEEIENDI